MWSTMGDDVLGDDVLGDDELDDDGELEGIELVGARARRRAIARRGGGGKPRWRKRLAPGVQVPGYGVFPVPLAPQTNNGIFTAAIANITYLARPQFAFRGERLLTRVARVGASATGALAFAQNGVFIGTRPQMGVLGALNLEDYVATAFGVRLIMEATEPGGDIQIFAFVSPALTGTDTLALSIQILGRVAR